MSRCRSVQVGRKRARALAVIVTLMAPCPVGAQRLAPPPSPDRIAETQRSEGEALLALADDALAGKPVPADFRLEWTNDFLKAQQGTFVPFTVTVGASPEPPGTALLYVRAVPRPSGGDDGKDRLAPAVDAIVPVRLVRDRAGRAVATRGFSAPAGDYDVCVVVRERVDPANPKLVPRAAAMVLPLSVPDFWTGRLSTSSVMLARRLAVLDAAPSADELSARPYVIGRNELTPAVDRRFGTGDELIVVLLVYDAAVGAERQFDLDVEYHFFRRTATAGAAAPAAPGTPPAEDGETYFNHTEPQRFTPASMGPGFDPAQPVMAGQGIPLAGFAPGDYRLAVRVTDRLSGQQVAKSVTFAVGVAR